MKSLAEQMYVYASYHRDGRNKGFHFLGVPMLTFAILIPMAAARLPVGGFEVSLAMAFVAAVLVYYFVLDVPLAAAMVLFIVPVTWAAHLVVDLGLWTWVAVFTAVFVVGWIVQLVGHVFEGRKPALVDNLFQVLVAPIFLMAESFFALGAKKRLHDEVEEMIRVRGLAGLEQRANAGPETA